jgi:predicted MPP superfamily phosphohydrolase
MAKNMSRRRFLQLALGSTLGLGTLGIGGSAYATRVEPYAIEVTHLTLPLRNLPAAFDGLKLVQLSDWHLGDWMTTEHMLTIASQVNSLKPDVIVATGDFVSRIWRPTPSSVTHSLEAFQAPEGVFAVLGNHDHWTDADVVGSAVMDSGTILLNNANHPLVRGDEALYILGVDDVWEQKANLGHALRGIPDGAATILLAHEPDYADHVAFTRRVGLQLSGHSHGGQVRVPGRGALILPRLGKKYDMGLYNVNGTLLYVNRGVGMVSPHVRFNCPPEITHITLTRQA